MKLLKKYIFTQTNIYIFAQISFPFMNKNDVRKHAGNFMQIKLRRKNRKKCHEQLTRDSTKTKKLHIRILLYYLWTLRHCNWIKFHTFSVILFVTYQFHFPVNHTNRSKYFPVLPTRNESVNRIWCVNNCFSSFVFLLMYYTRYLWWLLYLYTIEMIHQNIL